MPDTQLALIAGITYQTVAKERRSRNIPPFRPYRELVWTQEMLDLLGTDSDRNVAAELKINHRSVHLKRKALGIPPFYEPPRHKKPLGHLWTAEQKALLHIYGDREVARRLGISAPAVANARRKFGIPGVEPAPARINWTREMLEDLGKTTDSQLCRDYRVSSDAVKRKRDELSIPPVKSNRPVDLTDDLREILAMSNRELRKTYDLSKKTIQRLRKRFDVPPPETRNLRWTPEVLARLGKEADKVIALDLGICVSAVRYKRYQLGIALWRPRFWTDAELQILQSCPGAEAAARIGRSENAIQVKRKKSRSAEASGAPGGSDGTENDSGP